MLRTFLNGKSVSKWVAKSSRALAEEKLGQAANWSKEQIDSTWKRLSSKVGRRDTMKPKITKKPWGQEELLSLTPKYAMKRITIRAGHRLSLQYHQQKEEDFHQMFFVKNV